MHVKAFFLSSCRNNILHIDLAHYNIIFNKFRIFPSPVSCINFFTKKNLRMSIQRTTFTHFNPLVKNKQIM